MSDETMRSAEHSGDVARALAERARAGDPEGRIYLRGHETFETALIQAGYPYGRRGKCLRAVWIEFKAGKGFRFVYRTTAPYYPEEGQEPPAPASARWNKPHASTYRDVEVLYLDGLGHVHCDGLGVHGSGQEKAHPEADIDAFAARAIAALTTTVEKAMADVRAFRRAMSRLTWTVRETTSVPVNIMDAEGMARLAREQAERKAEEARQNRLINAAIANERASSAGDPLPYPSIGTASNPGGA